MKAIIQELRPRQWIKNLSLYTAVLFSGKLFISEKLLTTTYAFMIFCLLSSFTYIINDIHDKEEDQKHPSKKNRPIASGKLPISIALLIAITILASALVWALNLSEYFFILSIAYVIMTTTYSLFLKNIAIVEAIIIAIGFVFRITAGSLLINTPISSWLTVCAISLALLISFGRRKAEITLLGFEKAAKHRPVLKKYPKKFLEVMISSLVSTTFLSYTIFTFSYGTDSGLSLVMEKVLPDTLKEPRWMMLTIPVAFYGIARYLYLIYNKREKGEPETIITADPPFLGTLITWGLLTLLIIYLPSDIVK